MPSLSLVFFYHHSQNHIDIQIISFDLSLLVGDPLDQSSNFEVPFLGVTLWSSNQREDLFDNLVVVFDSNVGHALARLKKFRPIGAEQTIRVQKEFLTKDVVFGELRVLYVSMWLFESFRIPIFIVQLTVLCFLDFAFKRTLAALEVNEAKVPGEQFCPLPMIIVIPQIDEKLYDSVFGFLPTSILINIE